ncbi:glycosyltransferase family 9 protein [Alteromonas sp. a30]|uniref:glycosyltransferase family 9 protein n=1 Tax=Alteromonas sp. a30 TaxID=2730917 RepID=UPI002282CEA3|nr:hypothetical protein [Alteromonas sp. a30]
MSDALPKQKILLIRMLGLGDVTCVGIPAIRYFKNKFPDAELHFLTYAAAEEVLTLAEPEVTVKAMKKGEWPDDFLPALEAFLGLAEDIIGEAYTQIVNLDTWFMPCFLARFLKDAGESVSGNYIAKSLQELLNEFQAQTLRPEFVNDPSEYIESSFMAMPRWHSPWWEFGTLPDYGYPEFFLRSCCGFSDIEMDMNIDVASNERFEKLRKRKKIVALATQARTDERSYPYGDKLESLLKQAGFEVWTGFDGSVSMRKTLSNLKASDLLVTVPSAPQWLATTVGCPSLVISGVIDPRTLMPDYATDPSETPVPAEELVESIKSIFSEQDAANA